MADAYSFTDKQLQEIGRHAVASMHEYYNDLLVNDVRVMKDELEVMVQFWGRAYEVTNGHPRKLLEEYTRN